jgi:hypothetical protein
MNAGDLTNLPLISLYRYLSPGSQRGKIGARKGQNGDKKISLKQRNSLSLLCFRKLPLTLKSHLLCLPQQRKPHLPRRIAQSCFVSSRAAALFLVRRSTPRIAADEAVHGFDWRAE